MTAQVVTYVQAVASVGLVGEKTKPSHHLGGHPLAANPPRWASGFSMFPRTPAKERSDVIKTYTIPEAAELSGIPKQTLYDAYHAGKLKAGLKRGAKRGIRVTEEAINEFWKELVSETTN